MPIPTSLTSRCAIHDRLGCTTCFPSLRGTPRRAAQPCPDCYGTGKTLWGRETPSGNVVAVYGRCTNTEHHTNTREN